MRDFETWIKSVEDRLKNHDRRIKSSGPRLPDTNWANVTLLNNWGLYAGTGSSWGPLAYRRFNGLVHIRGLLTKTVGGTAEAVGVLPVGFRPGVTMLCSVRSAGGETRLDVQSDGVIVYPEGVPNVAYVSAVVPPFIAEQ